jgi:hypothetical protein
MDHQKPMVMYLAYEPYGIGYLKKFLKNYKKFNSGYEHELLICFKKFNNIKNIKKWSKIVPFKFTKFIDEEIENDFDIGSYFRVAKKFKNRRILFLNTHTIPLVNNWLYFFVENYEKNSVIGATGSYASIPSIFFQFYFKQHTKFQQIKWGLKHMFKVKLFPNPHIRTTGFFMSAKDFLSLDINKNKLIKKIETNYFEGGRNGMSQQLISRGFKLLIINSDGKKFLIPDWPKSLTYCCKHQEKLIFGDNRTNEYADANKEIKNKLKKIVWGIK